MRAPVFYICAKAPPDVIAAELENYHEENDEQRPHLDIILRFAKANGAQIDEVKAGRGLPTTEAWTNWQNQVAKEQSWIAAVAALRVGTESQSPLLYGTVLPALRERYQFPEEDIEHFWLHVDADTEHGGRAFDLLERHCTTRELQELAIHYARESAKLRWFYFDGIYLHYELGYKLR
jgi:pyrroloquinoline-quinone synthase